VAGTPVPVAAAPTPPAPALYPLPAAPPPGSLPGGTGAPGTGPGNGRGTGPGSGTGSGDGPEDEGPAPLVERPDRSPVAVRFSEPAYPPEARREGVRARVRVRVLVDERGRVMEAAIVGRVQLGRGDREEPVASLPHGMDQAALDAARRYQFRPAQDDGRRVRSYTTITCSFGV
jgi:protein TonB